MKGMNIVWETDIKRGTGYESLWKEANRSEYDQRQDVCQILKEERGKTKQRNTRRMVGVQRWRINMLAMLKQAIIQLSFNYADH